jgi:hypothetical protein
MAGVVLPLTKAPGNGRSTAQPMTWAQLMVEDLKRIAAGLGPARQSETGG